jgi:hypothetical protein
MDDGTAQPRRIANVERMVRRMVLARLFLARRELALLARGEQRTRTESGSVEGRAEIRRTSDQKAGMAICEWETLAPQDPRRALKSGDGRYSVPAKTTTGGPTAGFLYWISTSAPAR